MYFKVIQCANCRHKENLSGTVLNALVRFKNQLSSNNDKINILIPQVLLDVTAYWYAYNIDLREELNSQVNMFLENQHVRDMILQQCYNKHFCTHKKSCSKKG